MKTGRLLTIEEAAERLAISRSSCYALVAKGQLRAIQVTQRARRIEESEIDRYVRTHPVVVVHHETPPVAAPVVALAAERSKPRWPGADRYR